MKKSISFYFLTLISMLLVSTSLVYAATIVPVYLDGKKLDYKEVEPQIVNNTTYVPFRETATKFGLAIDWNNETKTMTLTKEGTVLMHTINTNHLYLNGTKKQFDAPSIVLEDRTLMPVRMIAEALGSKVEWDDGKRQVTITTTPDSIAKKAVITEKDIKVDDTVNVTVTANQATARIKLVAENGVTLVTSETYTTDGTNRLFKVQFKATAPGNLMFYVYSGNDKTFNKNADAMIAYSVSEKISVDKTIDKVAIFDAKTKKDKVKKDETVEVTVTTLTGAKKVYIQGPDNKEVASTTSVSTKGKEEYTWVLTFKGKMTGTYTVYATDDTQKDYTTFKLEVEGSDTTSTGSGAISDVKLDKTSVSAGEQVVVYVYSEGEANSVWIKDSNGDVAVREYTYHTRSGNTYEYRLIFDAKKSGTHYAYVKDFDGKESNKSFSLSVSGTSSNSGNSYSIYNVNVSPDKSKYYSGDRITVTVKTNTGANSVYIEDPNGSVVTSTSSYRNDGNSRYEWELSFTIERDGTYKVRSKGYSDSEIDTNSITLNLY